MTSGDPPYLVVAHVKRAHGTRGEVAVASLTDHPESTFAPGVELEVGDATASDPDPAYPSLTVEASRPHKKGYLVRFEGLTSRNEAELLAGRDLLRPLEDTEPLEEGELFQHQLLGMEMVTVDGEPVGEVVEVFELGAAGSGPGTLLLEVRGGGRTRHIPLASPVVTEVDVEEGRIVLDPPEGLLDL